MSETRDKVIGKITDILAIGYVIDETIAVKILSIHELAIVDRKAELPKKCQDCAIYQSYTGGASELRKEGWIKEIKE